MEIGKKYKVAYNEGTHVLFASGKLISIDDNLICVEDYRDGKVYIGKRYISRMNEVNDNGHR